MSSVNKRLDAAAGQTNAAKLVWPTRALGDVCDVIGGGTPSKEIASYYGGSIPWATVRDLKTDLIENTEYSITTDAVQASATNIIPAGNVIIATRVGLGKVCILGQDTAINQDLRGIIPRDGNVRVKFLYHWLRYIAPRIIAEGSGATVQGVKLPFIKSLQMPLPTIPEQERIVAVLDEAFEGIAAAKANAKKNLQVARALLEAFRDSIFLSEEVGTHIPLREIAAFRNGVNFTRGSKGRTLTIVGVRDFQDRFFIPTEGLDSVTIDGEVNEDDILRSDDLLTVRSNGNAELIGRTMVADDFPPNVLHSGFTIRTRLLKKDVSPRYLCHFMRSSRTRRQMIDGGNGVNIKSLNQGTLGDLTVPLPAHQKQIAIAGTNRADEY